MEDEDLDDSEQEGSPARDDSPGNPSGSKNTSPRLPEGKVTQSPISLKKPGVAEWL